MSWRSTILLMLAVLALGAYLLTTRDQSAQDERTVMAARRAFRFEPERIDSIRIDSPDGLFMLERADASWRLTHPVSAHADIDAVGRIIDTVTSLRWSQVISAREQKELKLSLADYGLDQPRASLELSGGSSNFTLLFGRDTPDGRGIYMKRSDLPDIFVSARDLLAILPSSVIDLRDRRIMFVLPDRVRRVEWLTRNGTVQASRLGGEQWQIDRPFSARANGPAIRQWLDRFYTFQVHEFIAESVAAGSLYGFDEPTRLVTIGDDRGDTYVLKIGNAVDAAATAYYASIQGREQVFSVLKDVADWLQPAPGQFRDYRVMTLPVAEIKSIRMTESDYTLELNLSSQGVWEVVSPKRFPASPERVDDLLEAWAGTPSQAFIDPPFPELTTYGLEITNRQLFLARKIEGEPDFVLTLGATNLTGSFYASTPGIASVLEMPGSLLDQFTVNPMSFRVPQVLALSAGEVQRIAQTMAGITYAVELREGLYRASGAGEVPDTDAINEILFRSSNLQAISFIEEDPSDLTTYGLDPAFAQVVFGLASSGLNRVLLLGSALPDGEGRYAMLQGTDLVFTLDNAATTALLKPVANPLAPVPLQPTAVTP
ncbi:MAG: DUF4340 domain-containing protein [Kiritimatiellia bacterium]